MPARSSVELTCKLVIESVGRMTTIFDWRRVVIVIDRCMLEDMIDRCSFEIHYSANNY